MKSISMTAAAVVVVMGALAVGLADEGAQHAVGGDAGWTFGFNYTDWALQSFPFYTGDTLLFKYEPNHKVGTVVVNHNVFLFQDEGHFKACDFTNAKLVAGPYQGEPGFVYKLADRTWYHFGCSAGNGLHCNEGHMKFRVKAMHHKH